MTSSNTTRAKVLAGAAATLLSLGTLGTGTAVAHEGHHHHKGRHSCSSTQTSHQDRTWLQSSIQGDHFEIAGGQLAQARGVDPMTKALGMRLESDHSESLAEATALAQSLGIPVPTDMSAKQRHELQQVAENRGLHFDDEYAELEVSDHKMDIRDAREEVEDGCNPQVRAEAAKELPMLHEHLTMSRQTSRHIETLPGHEGTGHEDF